jgi:hypothetical protein
VPGDARAGGLGGKLLDSAAVEDLALDRTPADDVALGRAEAVEAGLKQRLDRWGTTSS